MYKISSCCSQYDLLNDKEISIIGAGPVGLYMALLLNHKFPETIILIYEKDRNFLDKSDYIVLHRACINFEIPRIANIFRPLFGAKTTIVINRKKLLELLVNECSFTSIYIIYKKVDETINTKYIINCSGINLTREIVSNDPIHYIEIISDVPLENKIDKIDKVNKIAYFNDEKCITQIIGEIDDISHFNGENTQTINGIFLRYCLKNSSIQKDAKNIIYVGDALMMTGFNSLQLGFRTANICLNCFSDAGFNHFKYNNNTKLLYLQNK